MRLFLLSLYFLSLLLFSAEVLADKSNYCTVKEVKKTIKEAGEKGLLKTLGINSVNKGKGCFGEKTAIKYWLVGHFLQSECAEVVVFSNYPPKCGKNNEADKVTIIRLMNKKLYKVMDVKSLNIKLAKKPKKVDHNKDGIDELLLTSKSGGIAINKKTDSVNEGPEIHTTHLYKWKDGMSVKIFSVEVLWDDTEYKMYDEEIGGVKENPPYTVIISTLKLKDVNGDGIDEIIVSKIIYKYSDTKHNKAIESRKMPIETYYYGENTYDDPIAEARKAIEAGDQLKCIKILENVKTTPMILSTLANCYKEAGNQEMYKHIMEKYIEKYKDKYQQKPYDEYIKPKPYLAPPLPSDPEKKTTEPCSNENKKKYYKQL